MSLFSPPPGYEPGPVEQDLQQRWLPTDEQVVRAVAALKALPEAERKDFYALVPLAQPGKSYGVWTLGQQVLAVPGVWVGKNTFESGPYLTYGEARNLAGDAARAHLRDRGLSGTVAYVSISEDGSAAVFEDFGPEEA